MLYSQYGLEVTVSVGSGVAVDVAVAVGTGSGVLVSVTMGGIVALTGIFPEQAERKYPKSTINKSVYFMER